MHFAVLSRLLEIIRLPIGLNISGRPQQLEWLSDFRHWSFFQSLLFFPFKTTIDFDPLPLISSALTFFLSNIITVFKSFM